MHQGLELLEECGPWRLCGQCGTTVLFEPDRETVSALASTVDWPGQDVDDLHAAAKSGRSWLRRLIHRGLPLEAEDQGETPLMVAAENGQVRAARILIEHGARVEGAIRSAASSLSPAIHRLFLRQGLERNQLFLAVVRFGRVRDARLIFTEEIDVNFTSGNGFTPLYSAAQNCNGMVRFLLKRGADPNLRNASGSSPTGLCAFRGYVKALKVLVDAKLTADTLEEALVAACRGGRRRCFELLVEAGAAVNQQNYTPLMAAAENGCSGLVERLLELGADPSAVDDEGKRARDYAKHNALRRRLADA